MIKNISLTVFAFLLSYFVHGQGTTEIKRIDPPFWWAGMETTELQLLVNGENISSYTANIEYDGATISNTIRTDNPNYLFINLKLTHSLEAGELPLVFSKKGAQFTYAYELKERSPKANRQQGLNQEDVVYLIMPDRFSNGNKENDNAEGYADKANRMEPFGRHGGDLQGIINHLDYLADLGITAIWLTPFQDNNIERSSYHGYSMTDYYMTDPRFGSNEDYKRFVEEAHNRGIKVVIDIVFNQVGIDHHLVKDLPMDDWIHQFDEYTRTSFVGETQADYHAAKADRDLMVNGWFDKAMPDMNQENPLVAKYQKQYVTWWIEYANVDAIRFDTYQYNEKKMLADWANEIRNEYPELYIVAEVWVNDPAIVAFWQENGPGDYDSKVPGVFDFPLYYSMLKAFSDGSVRELYQTIAKDFLYSNASMNMTFNSNHDVDRLYNLIGRDPQKMKMIAGFLLTTRGIPQIYYGDELLLTGNGEYNHGNMRVDFPGGWEGDEVNVFTGTGISKEQSDYFNYLKKLLNWRKDNSELLTGKLSHFVPENEVYVYFRTAGEKAIMVIVNKNETDLSLSTERYMEILKDYSTAKNIFNGTSLRVSDSIKVPAMTTAILELN